MSEEETFFEVLEAFPAEHTHYRLYRAAGGDILDGIYEQPPQLYGTLEVVRPGLAFLFVQFPHDKGLIAGYLQQTPMREQPKGPPTFFIARACRAHINYGSRSGIICRDGSMIGAQFSGDTMWMGDYLAVAGSEDVSVEQPLDFAVVESVQLKIGEEYDEEQKPEIVEKPGDLIFSLFFPNDKGHNAVSVPLALFFEPQPSMDDSGIPEAIRQDIVKLAKDL